MEPPLSELDAIQLTTAAGGIDDDWDRFLEAHPWGRHEQTSRWGLVKETQGWTALRTVARRDGKIVGGFQLLHRHKAPLVRFGYLSHGPVRAAEMPELTPMLADAVTDAARRLRLRALALQTPREHEDLTEELRQRGFLPNRVLRVIAYTAELDLTRSEHDILRGMRRSRRQTIQSSMRGPLQIQEGTRTDLPRFFELMRGTCRRQGVAPNPPDAETLQTMWDLYAPNHWLRQFLVIYQGELVCGLLVIPFGDRFWLWKIGWSGKHTNLHPNDFLYGNLIFLAKQEGFRCCDFAGIDPRMQSWIADHGPVPTDLANTPSFYKVGFGPEIIALPPSLIRFRPNIANAAYRVWNGHRG